MMNNFEVQNICRICLVENNKEIQCVFDTIDSTEESMKLSEMLMACAKVKIISGDELPDQICSTCVQNTIKLYLFKIRCEESDKTLRNRLKEDFFMAIDKFEINEEDTLDKLKLEIKKEIVEETFDCLPKIENNLPETIGCEDYDVYCSPPKYSGSIISAKNSFSADNTLLITEESLKCETFQENDLLHSKKVTKIAHKTEIIEQELDCKRNEINEDSMSSLKNSVDTHKEITPFFTSGVSSNLYECDMCEKKFKYSSSFLTHKRMHTGKSPFACDVCKKTFRQSSKLTNHKRIHTGEKPFACDVCGKSFCQSSQLATHKRIHTGEKPYKCDLCKKEFTQSSSLLIHKRRHAGEKPFACDVCEKRFCQLFELVQHKRKHTGERPYKCDLCEEKFRSSSSLLFHKRGHTGEKPFVCDVCEKAFCQSCDLANHKLIHTGERPYKCDLCEKKFTRSSKLRIHKRTHTRKIPSPKYLINELNLDKIKSEIKKNI